MFENGVETDMSHRMEKGGLLRIVLVQTEMAILMLREKMPLTIIVGLSREWKM